MKKTIISIFVMICMASLAFAQTSAINDKAAGMMPDSPLYFLDEIFDNFQDAEKVMDEKVSEMIAMSEQDKITSTERAKQGYELAIKRRRTEARNSSVENEDIAKQLNNHLKVLNGVKENAPQQAQEGLSIALESSARERKRTIEQIRTKDESQANRVQRDLDRELPDIAKKAMGKN